MSSIVIRGARQHNLADLDLELPRDRLIVVCGPSGSGKTSLVFDTLHAEGQRRYLDALAGAVRPSRPLPRAAVDLVLGLPPTLALRQGAPPPDARATVAGLAEVAPGLRVLWARRGVLHCPQCNAEIHPVTHDVVVGALLGLPAGSALTIEAPVRGHAGLAEELTRSGFSRVRIGGEMLRIDDVQPKVLSSAAVVGIVVDRIKLSEDRRDRVHDAVRLASRAGRGVLVARWEGGERAWVDRPYCQRCAVDLPPLTPRLLNPRSRDGACPSCEGTGCAVCGGTRLNPTARAVRWQGRTLPEALAEPIEAWTRWAPPGEADPIAGPLLADLARRFGLLVALGLGDLPLDRRAAALSTGEQQRIRLARAAGGGLSGVVYAFDEPSAGLGDAEVAAVIRLLRGLVESGNTVVATEHHPRVVAAADHVLELGPGAGPAGGRVVYQGDAAGLLAADTATGRWLSGRAQLPPSRGRPAKDHLGALVALTGPSGSGKSRRLAEIEADPPLGFERVVRADQLPLRATARSMPATVLGLWDIVRELLASTREAKIRGFTAGMFSLAVKGGRCEGCAGTGRQAVDLGVLPEVELPCVVCEGRRFAADLRAVTWKGHSPDQLLDLGADAAGPILGGHPKIDPMLRVLREVGLGYVPLGMPVAGLSGGEVHRLALARELLRGVGKPGATLYLLDGPTIGLHPSDVATLLAALQRLVDAGQTVWVATHDAALAAACDTQIALV